MGNRIFFLVSYKNAKISVSLKILIKTGIVKCQSFVKQLHASSSKQRMLTNRKLSWHSLACKIRWISRDSVILIVSVETPGVLALGQNSSGEHKDFWIFNELRNIELVSFYGSLLSRKSLLDLYECVMFLFILDKSDRVRCSRNSSSVREINNTVDIFLPLN